MIEPKVKAATGGATVAGAVVWALNHYVFHGALPLGADGATYAVVPGVVALVGGYLARHVNRPQPNANLTISGTALNSATIADQITAARQYIQTTYGAPTTGPATPSPARPPEAAQPPAQPETPTPEENPMSILDPFKALVEQLRGEVINKVAPEVADDIHAAFDLFKGQSAQLLIEAGHDAQTDAATITADATKVAADTAAAVTPAAAAPAETIPAPASSPETPGTPSA